MLTIVFEHLRAFPEWYQNLLLGAWGGVLLIVPLFTIIRLLQSPTMQSFFRATSIAAKQFSAYLQHQIDDPIKFPKVARALDYMMVVLSYLLAGWLFLLFLVMVIGWASATKPLSVFEHMGILGFSLFCSYWAAVLKTQGSRGLLKLHGNKNA